MSEHHICDGNTQLRERFSGKEKRIKTNPVEKNETKPSTFSSGSLPATKPTEGPAFRSEESTWRRVRRAIGVLSGRVRLLRLGSPATKSKRATMTSDRAAGRPGRHRPTHRPATSPRARSIRTEKNIYLKSRRCRKHIVDIASASKSVNQRTGPKVSLSVKKKLNKCSLLFWVELERARNRSKKAGTEIWL